jgi:hypothetical protein
VSFCHANVTGATQTKSPNALRYAAFNASSLVIKKLTAGLAISLAGYSQGFILSIRSQMNRSPLGSGTLLLNRASPASFLRKFDYYPRLAFFLGH